jgi:hypothetical protein
VPALPVHGHLLQYRQRIPQDPHVSTGALAQLNVAGLCSPQTSRGGTELAPREREADPWIGWCCLVCLGGCWLVVCIKRFYHLLRS